jgi:hypothetical protein
MAAPRRPIALLVVIAVLVATTLVVAAPLAAAELPRLEHPPIKGGGSLTVLAVGDWGRRGQFNQSLVAEQVRVACTTHIICLHMLMLTTSSILPPFFFVLLARTRFLHW